MGHNKDHAIIVSSHDFPEAKSQIEWAREVAVQIFSEHRVSNMIGPKHITNGRMSFFVGPDGSKEGWEESDENDQIRAHFCNWLIDNAPYVKFVEVAFADETGRLPEIGLSSEHDIPDHLRGF